MLAVSRMFPIILWTETLASMLDEVIREEPSSLPALPDGPD